MNTRFALLFCCVAIFAIGATQDASSLSSDQLHQLFSQGNYTETLKQVRIVLAQPDQSTVDRFDLLKLKGEALLRTKSDSEAADAYRDAAKAAKSEDDASLARGRNCSCGNRMPNPTRPKHAARPAQQRSLRAGSASSRTIRENAPSRRCWTTRCRRRPTRSTPQRRRRRCRPSSNWRHRCGIWRTWSEQPTARLKKAGPR